MKCEYVFDFLKVICDKYSTSPTEVMVFSVDDKSISFFDDSVGWYDNLYQMMWVVSAYVTNELGKGCLFEMK